ncbi:hypothetical protein HRbin27_00290 [bacterium HR27]|nr:hypothetical protein HRbin27_00290 [bacterium HR27]
MRAVETKLVDRLRCADITEFRRPVGSEDDQRYLTERGLDDGWQEVRGGRAGRRHDRERFGERSGEPQGEVAHGALVEVIPQPDAGLAGEREDERCRA